MTRAEMAWMGEVSRRSGRPVSFGLLQHDSRPDLYAQVIELAKHENIARRQRAAADHGAQRRCAVQPRHPQPVRSCVVLARAQGDAQRQEAGRSARSGDAHQAHRGRRRNAIRPRPCSAVRRQSARRLGAPRCAVRPRPDDLTRGDRPPARHLRAAAAYIELQLESDGTLMCSFPFLNQQMSAVEHMLDQQLVTLGLADAGAHVGQILDASQPTFLLSYWIRERAALVAGGGHPPAHQRHCRSVRIVRPRPARRRVVSPT